MGLFSFAYQFMNVSYLQREMTSLAYFLLDIGLRFELTIHSELKMTVRGMFTQILHFSLFIWGNCTLFFPYPFSLAHT